MATHSGLFAESCSRVPGGEEPAEEGGHGPCALYAVSLRCAVRQRQICPGAHEVHQGTGHKCSFGAIFGAHQKSLAASSLVPVLSVLLYAACMLNCNFLIITAKESSHFFSFALKAVNSGSQSRLGYDAHWSEVPFF